MSSNRKNEFKVLGECKDYNILLDNLTYNQMKNIENVLEHYLDAFTDINEYIFNYGNADIINWYEGILSTKDFIKDYKEVEKISVRTAYGVLASIVGIFCNVFLFAAKFVIGLVLHSVSVTADAFNNLSDAGSSIISFVGVKMAEKPADKDHPFGHGRIEYIAALVVSFLVLEVGFTFLKDSIGRIRTPEALNFQARGGAGPVCGGEAVAGAV